MSKFVRADRRFRRFLYVVVSLCFFAFIFILYEVHVANKSTQKGITSKIDESLNQNRIQNEETRQYVTCLLLVPIQERSEALQRSCFEKIDQPGGLQSEDFRPTSVNVGDGEDQSASAPSQNFDTDVSYPDSTAPQDPVQRDISQGSNSVVESEGTVDEQPGQPQPNILQAIIDPIINKLGGN